MCQKRFLDIFAKTCQSYEGNGWVNDPDFNVTCIGCIDVTTPAPTTQTIPDGSIPCVPGFYDAGYYFPEQECDGTAQVGLLILAAERTNCDFLNPEINVCFQCLNGQDENYGLCGDRGCGEVLSVVGHHEIEGFYTIRYSDGLVNGQFYYERVEPSQMYLYS